jgi:hypothetical protein
MGQVSAPGQTFLEKVAALWEAGLEALHTRIAPHFTRHFLRFKGSCSVVHHCSLAFRTDVRQRSRHLYFLGLSRVPSGPPGLITASKGESSVALFS